MHKYKGTHKLGKRWDPASLGWTLGWPLKMSTSTNLVVLRQRVCA